MVYDSYTSNATMAHRTQLAVAVRWFSPPDRVVPFADRHRSIVNVNPQLPRVDSCIAHAKHSWRPFRDAYSIRFRDRNHRRLRDHYDARWIGGCDGLCTRRIQSNLHAPLAEHRRPRESVRRV